MQACLIISSSIILLLSGGYKPCGMKRKEMRMTSLRPEPAPSDFPWLLLHPAISVGRPFFPVLCTRLAVRLIRTDERRHETVQLGNYIISGIFCITLLLFSRPFFIWLSQSAEAWEDGTRTGEGKTRATPQSVTGPPVEMDQRKRQVGSKTTGL